MGVKLDASGNGSMGPSGGLVSDSASRCPVLVLASKEDEEIARHAWELLT